MWSILVCGFFASGQFFSQHSHLKVSFWTSFTSSFDFLVNEGPNPKLREDHIIESPKDTQHLGRFYVKFLHAWFQAEFVLKGGHDRPIALQGPQVTCFQCTLCPTMNKGLAWGRILHCVPEPCLNAHWLQSHRQPARALENVQNASWRHIRVIVTSHPRQQTGSRKLPWRNFQAEAHRVNPPLVMPPNTPRE